MNIFSQFLLGATLGGLLFSKKIGGKALLFGGLCALIPAFDVVLSLFFEKTTAVFVSGGITHSIVFCVLLAPVLGWVIHKFVDDECSVVQCSFLAFCCMLSHCVTDALSIQGVGLLEPFTHRRFAVAVISNVDVFCLVILTLSLIGSLCVREFQHKAMISSFGVFLFAISVAFVFLNKLSVQAQFEQKLEEQDLRYSRVEVFPVSGSMFLWNCVAQDRDGFWVCYQSNLSKNDFDLNLILRNDYYLFELEDKVEVNRLEAYTRFFYSVEPINEHSVLFHDLRYGRNGLRADSPFAKTFRIDFENNVEISEAN